VKKCNVFPLWELNPKGRLAVVCVSKHSEITLSPLNFYQKKIQFVFFRN